MADTLQEELELAIQTTKERLAFQGNTNRLNTELSMLENLHLAVKNLTSKNGE